MFSSERQLLQKVLIADSEAVGWQSLGLVDRLPAGGRPLSVGQVQPAWTTVFVFLWAIRLDSVTPTGAGRVNHASTGSAASWAGKITTGLAAISLLRFQIKPAPGGAKPS